MVSKRRRRIHKLLTEVGRQQLSYVEQLIRDEIEVASYRELHAGQLDSAAYQRHRYKVTGNSYCLQQHAVSMTAAANLRMKFIPLP